MLHYTAMCVIEKNDPSLLFQYLSEQRVKKSPKQFRLDTELLFVYATVYSTTDCLHVLLKYVDVNCVDGYGFTALHKALCSRVDLEIVQMLLNAGADMFKKTPFDNTSLDLAVSCWDLKYIPLFLNRISPDSIGIDIFRAAVSNPPAIKVLLDSGVQIPAQYNNAHPLYIAIHSGRFDSAKIICAAMNWDAPNIEILKEVMKCSNRVCFELIVKKYKISDIIACFIPITHCTCRCDADCEGYIAIEPVLHTCVCDCGYTNNLVKKIICRKCDLWHAACLIG